jgi:hypothetical protein
MHLQCLPTHEGKSNVVCSVSFSVSATDGVNTACVPNTLMMSYDENQNFIEYESLTSDTVLGWVQNALGVEGINSSQAKLDEILSKLANPPVITRSLPWAT